MSDKRSEPVKVDSSKPDKKSEPVKVDNKPDTKLEPASVDTPKPDKKVEPTRVDTPKSDKKVEPTRGDTPKSDNKVEPARVDTPKPDNKVDRPKLPRTNPSNSGKPGPSLEVGVDVINAATVEPLIGTEVKTPCVNTYQQKKTFAQGMMDFALILANARQLKDVMEGRGEVDYYAFSLTLISISLALQIAVGGMLIWNSRFDVQNHHEMVRANRVNNLTVTSIFVITVTNVFISVFAGNDHARI